MLAHFGHAAIAELSLLSGVKRRLDLEPAKGSFWREADYHETWSTVDGPYDEQSEPCGFACSCDIAAESSIKEQGLSPVRMCRGSLMAVEAGQWAMMESCR